MTEYKVVVLGHKEVSTTISQLLQNHSVKEYYQKYEKCVKFEIIDMVGMEEYSSMMDQYIRAGDCYILVCCSDNDISLKAIKDLIKN